MAKRRLVGLFELKATEIGRGSMRSTVYFLKMGEAELAELVLDVYKGHIATAVGLGGKHR